MIIPFFIPHSGCPHQCVFCNQKSITGQREPVEPSSIPRAVHEYVTAHSSNSPVQIAFYGGSFTALPLETQQSYLDAAQPFIESGKIESIRLSTRPDCIDRSILSFLREHHVKTIELGAQSLDDNVLNLSGRGHTAMDTVNAVKLLREYGFITGLQLMFGLPGDSADGIPDTVGGAIALKPDFVRLYPVLVIKGAPLEERYKSGKYTPLSLNEAVSQCREAMARFQEAGIDVIRVGLQPTAELEKPGTILAGPYHPAFRQLVESAVLLDKMRAALGRSAGRDSSAILHVNSAELSSAIGQKRSNIGILKKEFGLKTVHIIPDPNVPSGEVMIEKTAFAIKRNLL